MNVSAHIKKWLGRGIKVLAWITGGLLFLLVLIIVLIQLTPVQNFLIQKVTGYISERTETRVEIGHISISFPKKIVLENIFLDDMEKDTLLSAGLISIDVDMAGLLSNKLRIQNLRIDDLKVNLYNTKKDSAFNYDFLQKAFVQDSGVKSTDTTTNPMEFYIGDILLNRISFSLNDRYNSSEMYGKIGTLDLEFETFDIEKKIFHAGEINLSGSYLIMKNNGTKESADTSKAELPDIRFKRLLVENVHAQIADHGDLMNFRVGKLDVTPDSISIPHSQIAISNLAIANSSIEINSKKDTTVSDTSSGNEASDWNLSITDVDILDVNFNMNAINIPAAKGFDSNHIGISSFFLKAHDVKYHADHTSATIEMMSFFEKSGFNLRSLKTKLVFDDKHTTLSDLELLTSNSTIASHLSISYESLKSINTSLSKMKIDIKLENSFVGTNDILLFQPDLSVQPLFASPRTIYIDSRISGTIGNVNIPELKVRYGEQTKLIASLRIKGLPEVNTATYDVNILELKTGQSDLAPFIPDSSLNLIPTELTASGNFKGTLRNFNTVLQVNSSLGDIHARVTMQPNSESYRAEINISEFNVGTMLQDTMFGKVSLTAGIDGNSFVLEKAIADIQLKVTSAWFNGYEYKDLELMATLEDSCFDGSVSMNDSNISFTFVGEIDLHKDNELFRLQFDLKGADLYKLNLSEKDLRLSAMINADIKGSTLNSFNGKAGITNLLVVQDGKSYTIDSLLFASINEEGKNSFSFTSSILTANFDGNIIPGEVVKTISHRVNRYFDIGDTSALSPLPQNFTFDLKIQNHPILHEVLMPGLEEFEPMTINGKLNSTEQVFDINVNVPRIHYTGIDISNLIFKLNADPEKLSYEFTLDEASNETIRLTKTHLNGIVKDDELGINLSITDSTVEKLVLAARLISLREGDYRFQILPGGLAINKQVWQLPEDNFIRFGTYGLMFNAFNLSGDEQFLEIHSPDQSVGSEIDFNFKNFELRTLSQLIEKDSALISGALTGNVHTSKEGDAGFTADLEIKSLAIRTIPVSDINLVAKKTGLNSYTGSLKMSGNDNDVVAQVDFTGGEKSTLDGEVQIKALQMNSLAAFTNGQISNASGNINGHIKISGQMPKPDVIANIKFNEAAFHSAVANNYFTLKQEEIKLDNEGIYFENFTIIDSTGNLAVLNGEIKTKDFEILKFDLDMTLDNFTILNTTIKDNQTFYGIVKLNSNTKIKGTPSLPLITSKTKLLEGTQMTVSIPESKITANRGDGIVEFTDPKQKINPILTREDDEVATDTELKGIALFADLEIDKNSTLKIVVDPVSGDSLVIRGEGNLSFGLDASGKTSLTGLYTVSEGSYRVSLQEIIRKDFAIKSGSTINWNGDPMDAQVNIDAVYERKTSAADLVAGQLGGLSELEQNKYKQILPFQVILHIKGEMLKPEISFEIDLPEKYRSAMGGTVYAKLTQLNADESELNKQVFALLVLGRFMQEDPLASSGGGGVEAAARNSVSKILSQQLNKLGNQYIKGVELDFDLQSYEDYSSGTAEEKTQLAIGVKKQLFNERISVQVGSMVDLSDNANQANTNDLASDVTLEYKLTEDGTYRLKAFRQSQYEDILDGPINMTGVGIMYTRDFDLWKNLFRKEEPVDANVTVPYRSE